jgi:hypothetical protein
LSGDCDDLALDAAAALGLDSVAVLELSKSSGTSTFTAERITLATPGGGRVQAFVKRGAAADGDRAHGHRGGLAYETWVYETVLSRASAPIPKLLGAHHDRVGDRVTLLLEPIDDAVPLWAVGDDGTGAIAAARSIGRLQRCADAWAPPAGLIRYDAAYYEGWARRTAAYGRDLPVASGWLDRACEGFVAHLPCLLDGATLVHGELYAGNVLVSAHGIWLVDWESAAWAVGEIDVATLTEGWQDSEVIERCEAAYVNARWSEDPPAPHRDRLALARVYVELRWLGDRVEWTRDPECEHRFRSLRAAAERAGLL